ncbi:MAG TPA: GNAT family N-acetyltransferase [Thermoanaerobaculia bacterium]|nr:GNAT family N-acetyltransferase [Thermoanaerobaculia bacterium]
MDLHVQHDEARKKYYAMVDGKESVLEYTEAGDRTLNFWHTYVPPELRGRGIADEIVRVALEDAMERGFRVIPSCWFVRVYMQRHQRFQEALA